MSDALREFVASRATASCACPGSIPAHVGMIAFESRVAVLGLAEKETSLEDAFLELTEEDARPWPLGSARCLCRDGSSHRRKRRPGEPLGLAR